MQSSTAAPTSNSREPTVSAVMPAHNEAKVASIRARSRADPASRPPTITEIAASPCQPSTIAPQSMDTRSPSRTVRDPVSYTHLRAHETVLDLVCRLLLEKKN